MELLSTEHYEMISAKAYKSVGLLHRVFKNSHTPQVRKSLYISLVRAKLLYCSPLWKPYLLKDIELLQGVQWQATKFILSDYSLDYRTRLIKIGILPLLYVYEIADILFFIKSLKQPSDKFNILDHVTFTTGTTRSAGVKLYPKTASTNYIMNTYFYRLPCLWNSLPIIDLSQPVNVTKSKLKKKFMESFFREL